MFTYKINEARTEMTIFKDGRPVYKAGYNRGTNDYETHSLFEHYVDLLKHQIRY